MKQIISSKINSILGLLLLSFPILIILGSFALNCFSIIFSLYAIFNYKRFLNINYINPKAKILFFSFIILIFPFESFEFQDSFSQSSIFKYLSFSRFVLMLFGLIIFLEKNNKTNFFSKIYKTYVVILLILSIDILFEYLFGYNLFGYKSSKAGRIASFTNDELIIGYIFCFTALFTLTFIFKRSNHYYFFILICFLMIISFIVGERSNFLKFVSLIMLFYFIYFVLNSKKLNIKKLILFTPVILVLLFSFYQLTKNTKQGKSLFDLTENLVIVENGKYKLNVIKRFKVSTHAPHYAAAYKIFLNYPIFGIGINNFYSESTKAKYEDGKFGVSTATSDGLVETPVLRASTHPHQIYLEIISEVGLVGLVYCIFIFFYPIYISLKSFKKNKEIYFISHLLLHIFFIFPILPSGSFFGTNYGIPFWFNLSILIYLSNKNFKFHS
tara:strand:+ start:3166 stop:4491 length:1326 start_codon:yes stop_codon:yes gene_type:complete